MGLIGCEGQAELLPSPIQHSSLPDRPGLLFHIWTHKSRRCTHAAMWTFMFFKRSLSVSTSVQFAVRAQPQSYIHARVSMHGPQLFITHAGLSKESRRYDPVIIIGNCRLIGFFIVFFNSKPQQRFIHSSLV